jgi:hypothetical protein
MTAEWEHRLSQVERREIGGDSFLEGIATFIKSIVQSHTAPKPELISLFPDSKHQTAESVGKCPRCSSPVREGAKGFFVIVEQVHSRYGGKASFRQQRRKRWPLPSKSLGKEKRNEVHNFSIGANANHPFIGWLGGLNSYHLTSTERVFMSPAVEKRNCPKLGSKNGSVKVCFEYVVLFINPNSSYCYSFNTIIVNVIY